MLNRKAKDEIFKLLDGVEEIASRLDNANAVSLVKAAKKNINLGINSKAVASLTAIIGELLLIIFKMMGIEDKAEENES